MEPATGRGRGAGSCALQLTRRLSLETGIPVQFESSGTPLVLGAESERSLLMIIREAIQNALRHAAPQHLSVTLGFDRRSVQVDIEDDAALLLRISSRPMAAIMVC